MIFFSLSLAHFTAYASFTLANAAKMETKVNVKITKLFFFFLSSTSHLHTLSVWICREQSQWVCKINTDFVEFVHLMCRNGCKIDQLAIGSQSLDTYICAMCCVNWFQCSSQSLAARMVAMKKKRIQEKENHIQTHIHISWFTTRCAYFYHKFSHNAHGGETK